MSARTVPHEPRRRRRGAALATLAFAATAGVVLAPFAPAGADEPYLPQDVGLHYESAACGLHLGAFAEIKYGAEVHVTISSAGAVAYHETFVIEDGGSGLFDETLQQGEDFMLGAGGGAHIGMALTYEGLLIDDYSAPFVSSVSCPGLVPLEVTVDATGPVPPGAELQVAVRTGECGNDQTPSAVLTATSLPTTFSLWAEPGATCPSPVDTLGATMTYLPDQQTQVEDVVGAAVTAVFGFADAPVDPEDPADPVDPADPTDPGETTTTVGAGPSTTTVGVLPANLTTAATPVATSPRFTG